MNAATYILAFYSYGRGATPAHNVTDARSLNIKDELSIVVDDENVLFSGQWYP